jgi:hypothetical protein
MESIPAAAYWSLLVLAGGFCGFLNTLASSGSAVSLPILVMLGLPEGAANATNRLPVLVGSLMAGGSFARSGQVDWSAAAKLVPSAAAGSVAGVLLAEAVSNREMGLLITGAVLLALLMLFTKVKDALALELEGAPVITPVAVGLMFLVGAWLGFIVLDGATYLLLVLMLVCRYPLPLANALKVLIIAVTTLIPIAFFWDRGDIRLVEGIVLAAGSVAGGHLGAVFSNRLSARTWAFRMLVVVILLELVHLAWHYSAPLRAAA